MNGGARFSFVLTKSRPVLRAIGTITDDACTPVRYPSAVLDPNTGELISDAEVAEVDYTAFAGTKYEITARLIVRRVRDRNHPDELFPVWRFTNNTEPVTDADITHRQHAIIESVFADLIDGPLAHMPSGLFAANTAWATPAAITHNLLRAAGTLTDHTHARGATLRRHLVKVPARMPQAPGQTNPAPTSSLASSQAMENLVGQHLHRSQPTRSGLTPDHRPGKALPGDNSGRAGETSSSPTPVTNQPTQDHRQPKP